MAIYRVHKTKDYTVMSNHHLKDKELSLKAKGMMSLMLSLPDTWNFSACGLETLSKDGIKGVEAALKELENRRYLIRSKVFSNGRISDWQYDIFEKPVTEKLQVENVQVENVQVENVQVEKLQVENSPQLNTKELSTKELNTKECLGRFTPPTLEEVKEYCNERKNGVDAERFIDFYSSKGWMVGKNKMKDWKAAVRTWERDAGYSSGKAPKKQEWNFDPDAIELRAMMNDPTL